jgi:hypothetical protein
LGHSRLKRGNPPEERPLALGSHDAAQEGRATDELDLRRTDLSLLHDAGQAGLKLDV